MPDIYQIAEDERRRLLERDAAAVARIKAMYGAVVGDITKEIAIITGQIQALRQTVTGGLLAPAPGSVRFRSQSLTNLQARQLKAGQWLKGVESRLEQLAKPAAEATAWHQTEASKLAKEAISRVVSKEIGTFAAHLNPAQTEAAEALIGFAGNGSPLRKLYKDIAGQTADDLEGALFSGIARGQNPLVTARHMRQAASLSTLRAQTIARTETIRAYRETQHLSLKENSDVLDGWIWTASKSERSCAACLAMDGTFHKAEQRMNSHPNCRCVAVPVTKPITEIGLPPAVSDQLGETRITLGETGAQWLRKQPIETQNFILGPKAGVLYRKNEVDLQAFVGRKTEPGWGTYYTKRSLKKAMAGGGAHPGYKMPPAVRKAKRGALPPAALPEPVVSIPTPLPPPPEPGFFKDVAEAETHMEALYPNIRFDLQGWNIDMVNPNMQRFHQLAQEWPDVAARLKYVGTLKTRAKLEGISHQKKFRKGENAFAYPDGSLLAFNPQRMGKGYIERRDGLVQSGYYPKGTAYRDATTTHEFGHLVDYWLTSKGNQQFGEAAWLDPAGVAKISQYATINIQESFAEAFTSLRYTPHDLRAPLVHELEKILAKAKIK